MVQSFGCSMVQLAEGSQLLKHGDGLPRPTELLANLTTVMNYKKLKFALTSFF